MLSTALRIALAATVGASLCAISPYSPPADRESAAPAPAPARAGCPVVDVMVAYTPKAAAEVGGRHRVSASAQQIATRMNRSLKQSGVCGSIRITHAYTATDYDGSEDFAAAHQRLKDKDDPTLGGPAHQLREWFAADLVAVMVNRREKGGGIADYTATLGESSSEFAYAVADVQGIALDSVSHEIGHNLGLAHDRTTLATDPDGGMQVSEDRPYNTGWITPDHEYYTIMAYGSSCGDCTRVGQFSNPDRNWHGQPLGNASNDSARALRETLPVVAGYRTSPGPFGR
ncbi:M12 family metallo-peptidase [Streptomyces sp. NPDC057136]|uniref:M12 family metallo-peptidase n=1 Tax=Streptomyces sp. NPDC057136 TaxID=3346029 RepID=UPI00363261C1